jgi:hypothetical protein
MLAAGRLDAQTEPVAERPTYTRPVMDSVEAPVDSAPRQGPNCWRAKSGEQCIAFFVTDIGLEYPLYTTRRTQPVKSLGDLDFDLRMVWTLGVMRNIGRHATGPAVSITSEPPIGRLPWMLEWRYRNWLNSNSAVDVGVGYKTNSVWQNGEELKGRGVTAMVAWTPNRWIGVSARTDIVGARGRTHRAIMIGAQSTRASEFILRTLPGAIMRELLARIGVEWENETNEESTSARLFPLKMQE